jgi:hypothetical protein
VDSLAIVGMICTQYNRQFRVCPRPISTQMVPGMAMGTAVIAWRTVSAVGPSESLQVSGRAWGGAVGFQPQPEASKTRQITMSRRTR